MQTVTTIGLDIAKSVFQVNGVDASGQVVIRRQLKRRYILAFFQKLPPCLVGIEACASSHHWSRELQALGHTVRLTPGQQSCLTLHRTRHLFIRQQTSLINAVRAHMAEFGIVAPVGRHGVEQLLQVVADKSDKRLPEVARTCVAALGAQLQTLKARILEFDRLNKSREDVKLLKRFNEVAALMQALESLPSP
jgi:transposase